MAYQALYRKYRSQDFDEIVGQRPIIKTLINSLKKGKISHAYLFSGPRGTGKTSVARLFAKALNCQEGVGEICNKCESCLAISQNRHQDIIEIDAASNSGVDEVRELIEKVKYAPMEGRYKVYIIDEVHMMTNNAFNALLKTLEEPPAYVVFILCTTEPYKLLPTIISRCQRYEFKKIDNEDLKTLINKVLKSEIATADNEAVDLLVELANGGARDALSLLDQILAYSGNNITSADIETVFGLITDNQKIQLLQYLKSGNVNQLLSLYDSFLSKNIDISRLIAEILDLLKDALIYLTTHDENLINKINTVKTISSFLSIKDVNDFISEFMNCSKEIKIASNPSFTFEVYLLKIASLYQSEGLKDSTIKDEPNNDLIKQIQKTKQTSKEEPKISNEEEITPLIADEKDIDIFNPEDIIKEEKVSILQKKPAKVQQKSEILKSSGPSNYLDDVNIINILVQSKKDLRKKLSTIWSNLEDYLDDEKFGPYANILLDATIFSVSDDYLILNNNYESKSKKTNLIEYQSTFAELIEKITGKKYFVYSLGRSRSTEITKKFYGLMQLNKLPKADEIPTIHIEQIEEE